MPLLGGRNVAGKVVTIIGLTITAFYVIGKAFPNLTSFVTNAAKGSFVSPGFDASAISPGIVFSMIVITMMVALVAYAVSKYEKSALSASDYFGFIAIAVAVYFIWNSFLAPNLGLDTIKLLSVLTQATVAPQTIILP